MRLAWRNLSHDRLRFVVTMAGIAFAVFLMLSQGSLLAGFVRAASKVIDATEADLWIAAPGVSCIDFPAPLPKRFRDLAFGVPGVHEVRRLVLGVTSWQKPSGMRQTVMVVGADPGIGRAFPLPYTNRAGTATLPETVLIDRSNAGTLGVAATPSDVEISRHRAHVGGIIDGFGSFIGTPYIFTDYKEGGRYLSLGPEETIFLLVWVTSGYDVRIVQEHLRAKLPEADVWTRQEFSRRAQSFWLIQTGAGSTILMAALLGFLVGLVVVSQNIYAMTMENIEEFATLKALGAARRFIRRVVLMQALASSLCGSIVGLGVTFPLAAVVRSGIPWLYVPWWLPLVTILVSLLMCGLASIISIRKAVWVEPGRVFRA